MSLNYASRALTRIIAQYRDDSKMRAFLSLLGDLIQTEFENYALVRRLLWSIDDMSGVQLDLIGRVLVQPRPITPRADVKFFGYAGTPGAAGYGQAPYYDPAAAADLYIPLPDGAYKRLLKSKAARNNTDCSIDHIIEAAELVTGLSGITLTNNQDMTFALVLPSQPDPYVELLLDNYDVIPAPAGVEFAGWSVAP